MCIVRVPPADDERTVVQKVHVHAYVRPGNFLHSLTAV